MIFRTDDCATLAANGGMKQELFAKIGKYVIIVLAAWNLLREVRNQFRKMVSSNSFLPMNTEFFFFLQFCFKCVPQIFMSRGDVCLCDTVCMELMKILGVKGYYTVCQHVLKLLEITDIILT